MLLLSAALLCKITRIPGFDSLPAGQRITAKDSFNRGVTLRDGPARSPPRTRVHRGGERCISGLDFSDANGWRRLPEHADGHRLRCDADHHDPDERDDHADGIERDLERRCRRDLRRERRTDDHIGGVDSSDEQLRHVDGHPGCTGDRWRGAHPHMHRSIGGALRGRHSYVQRRNVHGYRRNLSPGRLDCDEHRWLDIRYPDGWRL